MIIARINRHIRYNYEVWFKRWMAHVVPRPYLDRIIKHATSSNDCIWIVPGTYQDHEEC